MRCNVRLICGRITFAGGVAEAKLAKLFLICGSPVQGTSRTEIKAAAGKSECNLFETAPSGSSNIEMRTLRQTRFNYGEIGKAGSGGIGEFPFCTPRSLL